jgi:hypothetical protein
LELSGNVVRVPGWLSGRLQRWSVVNLPIAREVPWSVGIGKVSSRSDNAFRSWGASFFLFKSRSFPSSRDFGGPIPWRELGQEIKRERKSALSDDIVLALIFGEDDV